MRFEIYEPLRILSEANLREHWHTRYRRHQAYRTVVNYAWKRMPLPRPKPPATITLCRIAPRLLDDDNLRAAFKTIRDEIAGLLIPGLRPGMADGHESLKWEYEQRKGKAKEYALSIVIETSEDL